MKSRPLHAPKDRLRARAAWECGPGYVARTTMRARCGPEFTSACFTEGAPTCPDCITLLAERAAREVPCRP